MRRRLGLRARFLLACFLFVVTTVVASAWSLWVLLRVGAVSSAMVRDSEGAAAATSALASALEREDDALLFTLGDPQRGQVALANARARTDEARSRLRPLIAADEPHPLAVDSAVATYRSALALLLAEPGPEPLERYHREVNPRLRLAVAAVGKVRDRHFEQARRAAALAREEISRTRSVVASILVLALLTAVAVALYLAQVVITPLRQLALGAHAIREGRFEARIAAPPGDEIGQVAAAFNDMAERLAEFRRSNLGEVLRAKATLEAMMRALPDAVLLVDSEGSVASRNPAADDLFERMGQTAPAQIEQVVDLGIDRARVAEVMAGSFLPEHIDLGSTLRCDVGGETRRLLPRIVRTNPAADERSGFVLVLSDVTELARLDEMRAELVAVASHELRTPVTTLRMTLLMLQEGEGSLPSRARELLSTALVGADQIAETVDELLDMTHIEAGRLKLSCEPIDAVRLIQEIASRAQMRADEGGVRLSVDAAADLPPVFGDRARLRIVLDNLLSNALKYTPPGGMIRIDASSAQSPASEIEIAVTDSGPGVPAEFRERVFEKFFRVEHLRPGRERGLRGSGIGLYLSREIIELHGGRIRCAAGPSERGTRMVFHLPAFMQRARNVA